MCNVEEEDIEDISNYSRRLTNRFDKGILLKCKKCEMKSTILLQKKDPFCRKCFFEYCSHKFRSTIGKSKKIKHGDKVLLACSGGRKSTALLHLTKETLDFATAKQISFTPEVLFIDESLATPNEEVGKHPVRGLVDELRSYGYPVLYSSLEMVYNINETKEFFWNCESIDYTENFPTCSASQNCLKECMEGMSLSAKLDFIKHLRLLLITEVANCAGFKYVFVGDTACSLAENLLTDISLGRGSQISSDTNFFDTRFKVPVCRPLREFLNKEVALYIHLYNCPYTVLPDLLTKTDTKSSVQRLTESFITNLQENFPATVFTIFRTGGKLLKHDAVLRNKTCVLCKSKLDNLQPDPCSALEALKLSEKLSRPTSNIEQQSDMNSNPDVKNKDLIPETCDSDIDLFAFLCHGCSIPFRNNKAKLKFNPLFRTSRVLMERNQMKEEIKDFLINAEKNAS